MANLVLCGFEWGTVREASSWNYSMGETSIKQDRVRSGKYSCYVGVYDSLMFSIPADGYVGLKTVYVQFAVNFYELQGITGPFFYFKGQQGDRILGYLTVGANGQVLVYTGVSEGGDYGYPDSAFELRIASKTRVITSTWYVFEVLITIGETDGQIVLKIDGNEEGTFSGDTGNSNTVELDHYYYTDTISFYHFYGMWVDDVIVDDDSWPGCQKIVLLRPNSQGDVTEWNTTNDYENYEHVNDVPPDTEDYVYTTTTEKTDLYNLESLPSDAYEIATVRGSAWACKNSASVSQNASLAFTLKNGVTTTSTVFASTTQNLSLSWQLVSYSWNLTNPDTGYAWTVDDINNIQSGIRSK